jgi:hypothetical protein
VSFGNAKMHRFRIPLDCFSVLLTIALLTLFCRFPASSLLCAFVVAHLPFGCIKMSRQKRVATHVDLPAGATKKTRLVNKIEPDGHTTEDDEHVDEDDGDASSGGNEYDTGRDWVLEPDYDPYEEVSIDDDELDGITPVLSKRDPSKRIQIPRKLIAKLDDRCGDQVVISSLTIDEKRQRCQRFDDTIQLLVPRLKKTAGTHSIFTKLPNTNDHTDLLTNGFAALLRRGDEDFLVESILRGVPDSIKLVLGKEHFTLEELKSLPRLSNSELTEHGVYVDVIENGGTVSEWMLYVGSATGQFGVAQRWYTYLGSGVDGTHHAKEVQKPGRTTNLRCIAHFGFKPDFWLTTFTETIFMLYLGSIYDPRIAWDDPDYTSKFINDTLYKEVDDIRADCALPDMVEGRGLNRTWSLVQGWKDVGIDAGAECVNCKRVTPDPSDPTFKRRYWHYADPARPSGSNVICRNCVRYVQTNGKDRSTLLEERRKARTYATEENPGHCQHDGCSRTDDVMWCGKPGHKKYYCVTHHSRAKKGIFMDAPFVEGRAKPFQATRPNPGICEHAGCVSTINVAWNGTQGHRKYYCSTHDHRAKKGENMDREALRGTAEGPKPAQCQYWNCDSSHGIRWCKNPGHRKHYCLAHYTRVRKGSAMDPPVLPGKRKTG